MGMYFLDEHYEKMLKLQAEGTNYETIAQQLGCDKSSVKLNLECLDFIRLRDWDNLRDLVTNKSVSKKVMQYGEKQFITTIPRDIWDIYINKSVKEENIEDNVEDSENNSKFFVRILELQNEEVNLLKDISTKLDLLTEVVEQNIPKQTAELKQTLTNLTESIENKCETIVKVMDENTKGLIDNRDANFDVLQNQFLEKIKYNTGKKY